jgi:hypothetical protein
MEKPEKYLKKFAINEQQALGFIVEYEQLNDQIVYMGVPIGDRSNWLSINPLVIQDIPDPAALMEIVVLLTPENKVQLHPDGTQSINITNGMIQPIDWNSNINDLNELFGKFFKAPPIVKPPNSADFKLDNNEDSEDDGA